MRTRVWCDGSAKHGFGGWAAYIETPDGKSFHYTGPDVDTTNNRMELMAVIEALRRLPTTASVRFILDSRYVLDGITVWIFNWRKHHWFTADGKPVKNRDLWEILFDLVQGRDLEWHWQRGHVGDKGNERADALAHASRKRAETL